MSNQNEKHPHYRSRRRRAPKCPPNSEAGAAREFLVQLRAALLSFYGRQSPHLAEFGVTAGRCQEAEGVVSFAS
jgi:hypothetical protein